MNYIYSITLCLIGTLLGTILSLIPSLHIYNVMGLLILFSTAITKWVPIEQMPFFMIGMIVAYSFLNSVPSIYLGANDDSTVFVVFPGQKYMMMRKAHEAVILTGIGSLGGIIFLLLITPIAPKVLPIIREILTPHLLTIILAITIYMFMTEFARATDRPKTPLARLKEAWSSLLAGMLIFFLSGTLGFIVMNTSVIPPERAFQSLLPLFVGLFAVPWLILNIVSKVEIPQQHICKSVDVEPIRILRGVTAGCLGGLFAAFFPMVTGGIGAFLAGHATAARGDDVFLISQGANKVVYYVGGFFMIFMPTLHLTRGGAAWMLSAFYAPKTHSEYYLAAAAIAVSGGISFLLLLYASKVMARAISKVDYRKVSLATIAVITAIVVVVTGWKGVLIMVAATGIGLSAVLLHTRRMNCLGSLLMPILIDMAGYTEAFGRIIGLW